MNAAVLQRVLASLAVVSPMPLREKLVERTRCRLVAFALSRGRDGTPVPCGVPLILDVGRRSRTHLAAHRHDLIRLSIQEPGHPAHQLMRDQLANEYDAGP